MRPTPESMKGPEAMRIERDTTPLPLDLSNESPAKNTGDQSNNATATDWSKKSGSEETPNGPKGKREDFEKKMMDNVRNADSGTEGSASHSAKKSHSVDAAPLGQSGSGKPTTTKPGEGKEDRLNSHFESNRKCIHAYAGVSEKKGLRTAQFFEEF